MSAHDATERRRDEGEIRESEERYRSIVEQSMDGIYLLDAETGRVVETNVALQKMLGYAADELKGKELYDLLAHEKANVDNDMRRSCNERRFVGERKYRRKDSSVVDVEVGMNTVSYGGKQIICAIVQDIGKRKRTEETLWQSEARFHTIFQNSAMGISIANLDRKLSETNPAYQRMLGYSAEELVGKPIAEFSHPEDVPVDEEFNKKLLAGELDSYQIEKRYISKDGKVVWVRPTISVVRNVHGEPQFLIGMVEDVTEHKRVEEALRENEMKYRTLVEQIPAIVYIEALDEGDRTGHRLLYVSPQVETVLGYSTGAWMKNPDLWEELLHPEDRDRVLSKDARTERTGEPFQSEYRIRASDGRLVWLRDEAVLARDVAGRPLFWHGVQYDVTELKRAEEKLRTSESELRALFAAMNDVVLVIDGEGRCLKVVSANPRLLYEPTEEQLGKTLHEVFPAEKADVFLGWVRSALETQQTVRTEYSLSMDDGERWLSANISPMEDRVVWVLRDITERRNMEETLRESEERFRSLIQNAPDVITLVDADNRILYDSPAVERILGYGTEERIGTRGFDYIHPDDLEKVKHIFSQALESSRIGMSVEYRLRHKDGSWRYFEAIRTNLLDDPAVRAIVINYRDVTGRKHAEDTLKESEERFRSLVHNSYDVITVLDAQGTILYQSPSVRRVLGGDPDEKIGKSIFETGRVHREDLEKVRQVFAEVMANPGVPSTVEYRIRHADGSWRYIDSVGVNLLDDPSVAGVVVNYRDITERKEAEEWLRRSEERHRRQARELTLLHEVRTALAQELELPTVFRTVVEAIARTYGYTLVSAYLLQGKQLVLQHQVGYEHVIERILITEGVSGKVVRRGRAVLLEDVRIEPEFLGAIDGIVSEICVPLFDEGRVAGTLNVESTHDVKLTENDLRLMNALGEHVGIAIGRARLYTRVRESEERFRALVQNSSDLITLYDAEGTVRYVSPALERMLGYEPEERIGATSFGLIHPDDVARAKGMFAEVLQSPGMPMSVEVRAQHRDGSWRYIEAVGNNLLSHPSVEAVVLNGRDITDRREAEARLREAERRYRTLVERIPAITYIQEPDEPSRTTYISPQYEEILGYSPEECLKDPEHWIGILHPDDRERVLAEDRRANATGDPLGMEYRQLAKDGSVVWIRDEAAAVRDEEGRLRYWIGVQIDITERKTLEERLEYQAFHDSLTGLPNRSLFMNRLEHALSRTEREKGEVAVLFLDIDNLKVVNDTLGHEAGDWLLVAVTGRLRTCLRPADTVARLSGDEFAILLEDVEDVSRATQVAERVAEALQVPVALKERETFITASIGIALSGSALGSASASAQEQAESLLRQADLAMYRAKSKGKAHHEIFDPSMNAPAFERLEMGNDLRRALERDEFRVYYQPKMRLPTSLQQNLRFSGSSAIVATPEATKGTRIVGVEALVRWEHPERGLLSPEEFIPVAEESGLIVPIGRKVLEKACRQAQAWQDLYPGEEPLSMCVNISARQFQHPELTQDITRVLQQTGLEPRCLQLEITESVVMEDAHSTLDTLRKLEDLGVGLAIDDFGTGYSSLSYLKRFPVSFLKIDRLFVEPLGENPEDAMIVSGIISLAHTLGMKVVAEGVETAAQLAYLQGLGCDMAQGNYFCKPLQAEEASALFAKNSRR